MTDVATPRQAAVGTANALQRLALNLDEWAWAFIVERHGSSMLRTALLITGDRSLAEDACQEAFLHIRSSAGRFQPKGDDHEAAATGWIMRIAANSALQLARSRRRRQHYEQKAREQTASAAKNQAGVSEENLGNELRSELMNLPDAHRLPLMLHYFSGLDYESIATEVGCSVGAARMRVHRAIECLRSRLARVGCIMTVGAIVTDLNAAGTVSMIPLPQLVSHWNAILHSTAKPVISSAAIIGGATIITKISIVAAALAAAGILCATLAAGAAADAKKHEPRIEQIGHDAQSGAVRGAVTAIQGNGVTIKDEFGNSETYTAKWIGGDPASGGILDETIMDKLLTIRVGDVLEITWVWEEGRRISSMKIVEEGVL